jgi:hypothetical protein
MVCPLQALYIMSRTIKCNLIKHGQVCHQSLPAIKCVYLYVISFTHTQAQSLFLWKWRERLTCKYLIEIILWSWHIMQNKKFSKKFIINVTLGNVTLFSYQVCFVLLITLAFHYLLYFWYLYINVVPFPNWLHD